MYNGPTGMGATSVTDIDEQTLAKWLFTCPTVPPSIFRYLNADLAQSL